MKITCIRPSPGTPARSRLLLFFAGWGMDERPFLEYLPFDRDVMICYDYSSLDFDADLLTPYTDIKVVAWSMGVWAAAATLGNAGAAIGESVAVNGTPNPVDDARGIPRDIFAGTLAGLNEETLRKFRRRMCGSGGAFARFLAKAPRRSLEELRVELEAVGETAPVMPVSTFPWKNIIVGERDRIFDAANQLRAWEGRNVTVVDGAHYPEELWPRLLSR